MGFSFRSLGGLVGPRLAPSNPDCAVCPQANNIFFIPKRHELLRILLLAAEITKNEPGMGRDITQGPPNVHRGSTVGPPEIDLRSPVSAKSSFFGRRKKACFFCPKGGYRSRREAKESIGRMQKSVLIYSGERETDAADPALVSL